MVFYFTSNGERARGERLEARAPARGGGGGRAACGGLGPAAVRGALGRAPVRFLSERGRPRTAPPPAPALPSIPVSPAGAFLRTPGLG